MTGQEDDTQPVTLGALNRLLQEALQPLKDSLQCLEKDMSDLAERVQRAETRWGEQGDRINKGLREAVEQEQYIDD